jgi:hypothetical protein
VQRQQDSDKEGTGTRIQEEGSSGEEEEEEGNVASSDISSRKVSFSYLLRRKSLFFNFTMIFLLVPIPQ